jgi:hypothetical protein
MVDEWGQGACTWDKEKSEMEEDEVTWTAVSGAAL